MGGLVKDGDSDDGERISHLISKHETSRLSMSILGNISSLTEMRQLRFYVIFLSAPPPSVQTPFITYRYAIFIAA